MKCPFCEKEVSDFHPNSHVVPDWLYKHSFKKNKNLKSYGLDFQDEDIALKQSSFKASFICRECEGNFGQPEGYARLVFGDETNHDSIPNVNNAEKITVRTPSGPLEGHELIGLNFRSVQKFVLGVVLKGHMAKTGETPDLLGDKHFGKMKMIYLEGSEDDDLSYPILIFKLDVSRPLWNIVSQPCRTKSKNGMNLISFKGGGYEFNVNVQGHPTSQLEREFRLRKEGRLLILQSTPNQVAIGRILSDAQKLKEERWGH